MQYRAVIDQLSLPATLDPLSAAIFVTVFALAAALCARRAAFGLAALIAVQPFAFYRDAFGTTITFPKVVLLGVLVGLLTYGGAFSALRERAIRPVLAALALLAITTTLTFADAAYPQATLRETFKALEYLVACATAYLCYRIDGDDAIASGTIALVTAVVCATALVQELIGAPSGLCIGTTIVPRIAGVLEGPNQLAGYLEVSIAALAAWSVARGSRWTSIVLALATATAVLTFSRAGIAAMAVVAGVLLYAYRRAALRALAWAFAGVVCGVLAAAAWAVVVHAEIFRFSLDESACAGGVGNRSELYRAAWSFFTRHPLLGIGAGNFELELPLAGVSGVRTHANSWYLQSLAEGGVVLFAAVVALIVTVLARFAARLRAGSPWIVAAFAATLALALHQTVDYLFFYPKVAGPWLLLVGIAAATLVPRAREE